MSINKAQISRTMVINSPVHLWTLLKNKEEFYHNRPNINMFMYIADRYINGCRCDDNINLPSMNKEYNSLKNNTLVVEMFKNEFQCSDIIFNNNLES
jgi:hypothetical protein